MSIVSATCVVEGLIKFWSRHALPTFKSVAGQTGERSPIRTTMKAHPENQSEGAFSWVAGGRGHSWMSLRLHLLCICGVVSIRRFRMCRIGSSKISRVPLMRRRLWPRIRQVTSLKASCHGKEAGTSPGTVSSGLGRFSLEHQEGGMKVICLAAPGTVHGGGHQVSSAWFNSFDIC